VEEERADKGAHPSRPPRGNESRPRCSYIFVFEQSELLSRNEADVAELSQDLARVVNSPQGGRRRVAQCLLLVCAVHTQLGWLLELCALHMAYENGPATCRQLGGREEIVTRHNFHPA